MRCMTGVTDPISHSLSVLASSVTSWASSTHTVTAPSMTLLSGWFSRGACAIPLPLVKGTSVARETMAPLPLAIQRPRWQTSHSRWCATLRKTPSISRTTTTVAPKNRLFCQAASPTSWSMGQWVLPWVWQPIFRPTTFARLLRQLSGILRTRPRPAKSCWMPRWG